MKGLRCTTANCENNRCERCYAGSVDINERGVCKSKKKREGGALAQLFENYEAANSFELEDPETEVLCDADCVYNVNSKCSREHLLVEDGVIKTKCANKKKNDYPRDD